MPRRSTIQLAIAIASVLVLFAGLIAVMWRLGFFSFTGTDPSSKIVVGAFALVGSFAAAAGSIVGVLLKHSIDSRTAMLQRDAEQRLKLEAAISALQLFSTSSGSPSPAIQRDGALFTLASLDQHELTLALVADMLRKNELAAGTASSLLNQALLRGKADVQIQAITVLDDNAANLLTAEGVEIPACLENWDPSLSAYVREWAPIALGKVMAARPAQVWSSKYPYNRNGIIASLALAWENERDTQLKNDVGGILRGVISPFPAIGTLRHPRMALDIESIRAKVASLAPLSSQADQIVHRLAQWSDPAGDATVSDGGVGSGR